MINIENTLYPGGLGVKVVEFVKRAKRVTSVIGIIGVIPLIWTVMLLTDKTLELRIKQVLLVSIFIITFVLRCTLYKNVHHELLYEHRGERVYFFRHLLAVICTEVSIAGLFLFMVFLSKSWAYEILYLFFSICALFSTLVITISWIQHLFYATFERWYSLWQTIGIAVILCIISILAVQKDLNKELFVVGLMGFFFWIGSERVVEYFQFRHYLNTKENEVLAKIPVEAAIKIKWSYWNSLGLFISISLSVVMSVSDKIREISMIRAFIQSDYRWISEISLGFIIISIAIFLALLVILYVNSKNRLYIPILSRLISEQQEIVLNHIEKVKSFKEKERMSHFECALNHEKVTKLSAIKLCKSELCDEDPGTFFYLAKLHRALFETTSEYAGEVRTSDISKGGFTFTKIPFLKDSLSYIDSLPHSTFDEIITKYVAMNEAHPFLDGNGRAMRLWLNHMLLHAIGQVVDWSQIEKEDYLLAMSRSPIKDIELKYYLSRSLTDQVDNLEIFCRGLDASWYYEGYYSYDARDLVENLYADEEQ